MKTLLYLLLLCATLGLKPAMRLHAAEATIAQTLEKAVFEEESNRNLDAAILGYKGVLTAYDNQRNLAATALFRLGECYRKQGKTNDAALQYQRLIQQFPDQPTLIGLTLKTLDGLGLQPGNTTQAAAPGPAANSEEAADLARVKRLFKDSPDLVMKVEGDITSLHGAAMQGHLEVIRFLLDQNIHVDAPNGTGATALQMAAMNGRASAVRLLLERGAKVDAQALEGNTALCAAARNGFQSIVEVLLAAGADVNLPGRFRSMPLHEAIESGSAPSVKLLISKGANVNASRDQGVTPLMLAISPAITANLLENKADPNAKDSKGESSLYYAVNKPSPLVLMELLLKSGANPNTTNNSGATLLERLLNWADGRSQSPIVKTEEALLLLKYHANPNLLKPEKSPYFHWAVVRDDRLFSALVQAGANPNVIVPGKYRTPLFYWVEISNTDAVERMLKAGANPNVLDYQDYTPLELARLIATPSVNNGTSDERRALSQKIVQLLLAHGADETLYRTARIGVSRTGLESSSEVFRRDDGRLNSHTLFELLVTSYTPFPDFSRLTINRLVGTNGATTNLSVNVQAALKSGDCSANIPLQWGDVVVIPELDHPVQQSWNGPTQEDSKAIAKCLERQVSVISKGRTNQLNVHLSAIGLQFPLAGGPSTAGLQSPVKFILSSFLQENGLILSSSDLGHIKVYRRQAGSSSSKAMTLDISSAAGTLQRSRGGYQNGALPAPGFGNFNPTGSISIDRNELWLKDGDVIEIPDK